MNMQKNMSLLLVLAFALGVLTSVEFGQGSRVGGYPAGRSCLESEKQALRLFKRGLFDEFNYLSSWVGDDDCCSWHGVYCSNTSTGHVIELDLRNCSLRGDQILNSSLLDLKYLTYLDLSFNNFSGNKIPEFFGSFKELTYLDLSHSLFQGLVPHHLGNLSTLRHLDLSNNYYVYVYNNNYDYNYDSLLSIDSMRWLHGLSFLEHLDLSLVNFSKAVADSFPAINMLPNSLLVLKLHHCQLHNNIFSPLSFMNLTSLVSLDLGNNNFHGPIPEFVGSLTFLSELDLSYNNFQGLIPQSLGNLKSLSTLELSGNRLDDSIPSELGNLTKLTKLSVHSNQLIGCLPESICHLLELEELLVGYNKLSGNIPKCIGEVSNLIVLELYSNYWDGFVSEHHFINLKRLKSLFISSKSNLVLNISSEWIPPFQLQLIWMDSLKVGASIPRWLQTQNEIENFRMQNASLSIIPTTNWLVNLLSHAEEVDLSNNDFNGKQLSFSLTPQDDLILNALSLSNNNLSGDFPVFICNLTSLRTLVISRNNLSGKLPKCLGNLKNLTDLDVMDNSLSGDIPVSLGSLGNLGYLNLNNNKFQGKLPLSFQNLSKLVILDAGKNHLSDTLPLWTREQLPFLKYLILRSNSFHGKIPTQLCHHSSIQVLNLAHNQITGGIPSCFGNFSSMTTGGSTGPYQGPKDVCGEMIINNVKGCELQYTSALAFLFSIDLSNNHIRGEIPEELMNLDGLTNLNLTGNRLAGRIPDKIGKLFKLESLDLSKNEFSGPVPQSLSELNSLSSLNLSFNDLSGRIPTGNQLQTFNDLSIYAGNKQLCGQAILKPCPGDTKSDSLHNHSEVEPDFRSDDERLWFYAGIGPGVLVGFLGFCASLQFIKSWRYIYFHLVEKVVVALLQSKFVGI